MFDSGCFVLMVINFSLHIYELKWRVFYILFSASFSSIVAYIYKEKLLCIISDPLIEVGIHQFVYTSLTEAFVTFLKLSLLTGFY